MTEQKPFLMLHLQTSGWRNGRSFREKSWERPNQGLSAWLRQMVPLSQVKLRWWGG